MTQRFNLKQVEKLPTSEAQITGEITLPFLVEVRKDALKHISEHVEISGFRPGHIPEDVLVKHVGEMRVLEETAEIALGREYPAIIEEAKLSPISRPDISITKLAPGMPLEFKIVVAVEPEFTLPDYKQIARDTFSQGREETQEVTDKEVEETLAEIEKRGIKPELNEGEKIEDKVREGLVAEKTLRLKEKRRIEVVNKLVESTKLALPPALVESELSRMLSQFKNDVEKMGMKWPEYLSQAKKSEDDMKKEWKDPAEKRVKAQLVLAKIASEDKLEPAESEVEHEASHILAHHPEANPLNVRLYVYSQLRNEKVFELLESQGEEKKES